MLDAKSELPKSDTVLMPVLFRDGADRRTSARVPLSSPVRMGPPNGEPYAIVSARDVSVGGLFIDADRDVKVGARFSAEIVLPSGEKIYVPEAEVAYNRERAHGSGFGVRFIDAPTQVVRAIEAELERTGDLAGLGASRAGAPRAAGLYDAFVPEHFGGERGHGASPYSAPASGSESDARAEPTASSSALDGLEARSEPRFHTSELTDVLPRPRTRSGSAFASSLPASEAASEAAPRFDDPTESVAGRSASARASERPHAAPSDAAGFADTLDSGRPRAPGTFVSRDAFGDVEGAGPSEPAVGSMSSAPALGSMPGEPALGSMRGEPARTSSFDEELPSSFGFWGDLKAAARDLQAAVIDRSRNLPLIWAVLAIAGVLLVTSAVALALWSASRAEAVGPNEVAKDRGVSAMTHQALVGDRTATELVEPLESFASDRAPAAVEPKYPLPPLVYVENLERRVPPYVAPFGPVREIAPAARSPSVPARPAETLATTPDSRPADKAGALRAADAKAAAEAKAKAASTTDARVKAAEVKALAEKKSATEAAAPKNRATPDRAAANRAAADRAAADRAAADRAAKEARADAALRKLEVVRPPPKLAKVDAAKAPDKLVKYEKPAPGMPGTPRSASLRVTLGPKATVLKTHVYQAPHRFVIDLVGQDGPPALPAAGGAIRSVRFGRHPDFARVVIETTAPIASGRASKSGRDLAIALDFAR